MTSPLGSARTETTLLAPTRRTDRWASQWPVNRFGKRLKIAAVAPGELIQQPLPTPKGLRATEYRQIGSPGLDKGAVVAIGQFDGVHRGHQALIAETLKSAATVGSEAGVITFDRHPETVLCPGREPRELTNLEEKVGLLLAAGAAYVYVLHVEPQLLATEPQEFVEDVLVNTLGARGVVIGPNFRFGRRAAGDPSLMARLGLNHGFDVFCPDLTRHGDAAVSSTRIRAAVAAGDLASAVAMLGRPLAVAGCLLGRAGARMSCTLSANGARPRSGRFAGLLRGRGDGGSCGWLPVQVTVLGRHAIVRRPRGELWLSDLESEIVIDLFSRADAQAGQHRATSGHAYTSKPMNGEQDD